MSTHFSRILTVAVGNKTVGKIPGKE